VFSVPARNPNFTGRDLAIQELRRDLSAGSRVTVHSLHGLGGVGKTQLAVEYAHTYATEYDCVWWVTVEESATIPDQFTRLAARLGLEPAVDPDELRFQVHEALREVAGWLLVFDNADAVDAIRPWLPGGPMPPGVAGHVVVTTRRGGFAALGQVLDLDVIDHDAAVRLLRGRVPRLEHDVAGQIAEELGRLPLALEQAAAYLDVTQLLPEQYLRLMRTRTADMLARGLVASREDATVATVWNLSLERVQDTSPAAMQLLDVCAYLAPESIPEDLFTKHPDELPEPLAQTTADPLAFNEAIGALVDHSLVKRTRTGLQVHRLVQAAVRSRHHATSATTGAGTKSP
jgi:hypothetical protein